MHKKQSRIIPLVFGFILGILCMIYLPKYVQPYLPESIAGKETLLKGTVVVKEKKGDALLLTVSTPEGALLATFKQKAGEVNLLINEKDEVQFTVPNYMPFIDDPKIIRVVKEQHAVLAPAEVSAAPVEPARPAEKSMKGKKSRHQVKPQTAAPGSEMEVKPADQGSSAPPSSDKKTEQ
jgi:hypothetical protein